MRLARTSRGEVWHTWTCDKCKRQVEVVTKPNAKLLCPRPKCKAPR
jgi:hypothetical protein